MMGSGGMIVMDQDTCMVDVARYFINFLKDESCGKCTPCREGLILLDELLSKIIEGKGEMKDLDSIKQICEVMETGSLCGLGQTASNPVLSTFKYFGEEYIDHIKNKKCPVGKCKALIEFSINDKCTGCAVCAKNCPTEAITGVPKKIYSIDQSKCIKCGICEDVCKFEAVTVQ
ncbi:4Fe-4S binding protein, partial [bacterium]|nr:4Fe-4S binding protein [bacterium]